MDIKPAVPSALPSSWTIPQTVNMNDHGRKLSWTAQLSPYLRGLKKKSSLTPSPKTPKSPKSPRNFREEDSGFQITHTPDRPERPISRTAIPTDEQCMEFLMSLQRQEEHRRGAAKSSLQMWPCSQEDEPEDSRYTRSVRVESVQFEEARLARTNSSGPARMVEVSRSASRPSLTTSGDSGGEEEEQEDDGDDDDNESIVEPKRGLYAALTPPDTLHRNQSYLEVHTPRVNTSRWSDDSIESRLSSRDPDSPCVQRCQRVTVRSSAEEASSSPTVFGDDSMDASTPSPLTPVKIRPATPFTDAHFQAGTDPTTPPPSDLVVHLTHVNPAPVSRKYSWRSSKDTVLNAEGPGPKSSSWLPEPRPIEEAKKQQQQQQSGEPEVYGDWADYYFEDGNFWDGYSDDGSEEEETRVEGASDADDEQNEHSTDEEEGDGEEADEKDEKDGRQADEEVYPRYESFIKDYEKNVTSVTVTKV